jgi:hypothetical protein
MGILAGFRMEESRHHDKQRHMEAVDVFFAKREIVPVNNQKNSQSFDLVYPIESALTLRLDACSVCFPGVGHSNAFGMSTKVIFLRSV